jgi:C1A family cysteine protease
MKDQMYNNGPLENAFAVYQDFFAYKSGVYYHKTGGLAGYHATMDIGWGNEGGLDYWLVQNSWGTSWGMAGFFKIKMGDSQIDQYGMACSM